MDHSVGSNTENKNQLKQKYFLSLQNLSIWNSHKNFEHGQYLTNYGITLKSVLKARSDPVAAQFKVVFLNRRTAARYRVRASIASGS